ncbi:adenylate kinase 7-like [Lasioglossum baleicum]|uniref:adenylate kinase 7-like n=1 Tax=Lasioglossum baleicum TaxID=434251 RepID=UPI003FCE2CCE
MKRVNGHFPSVSYSRHLSAITRKLERLEQETPKAFRRNKDVRYFVLISTVMTWALTKPMDPEDPKLPFTEDDYRKRKPHPNFKEHIQCEKNVVVVKKKLNLKDKLKTVVICCGITYGAEEGPLHHLFKAAWQNEPFLPVLGNGTNKIPLLHVRDLITSVVNDAISRHAALMARCTPNSSRTLNRNRLERLSRFNGG